jgi:hypothetical protein
MHNGSSDCERVKAILAALESAGRDGLSGLEISRAVGALNPATEVSAVRAATGALIECHRFPNQNGRGRYGYWLHRAEGRCFCVPTGEPGPHYTRAGLPTDGREWAFNGRKTF